MKKVVVSGAIWIASGQAIRMLSTLITIFVLARLLTPADFGGIAIIIAIALGANMLADFGLGAALVQQTEITETEKSTVFWFNIAASVVLGLSLFWFAEEIAIFLNVSEIVFPLQVSALIFPLTSVRVVHRAVLERKLDFRLIAISEALGTMAGAVLAIALAFGGWGIWALVFQQLMFAFGTSFAYVIAVRWLPAFQFSFRDCRKLLRFGWKLTGTNFLDLIASNIYRPVISIILGVVALGYYNFALQIINYPFRNVSLILQRMAFPVLSRVQTDEAKFKTILLRMVHVVGLLMAPIVVAVLVLSENLVRLFFGAQWMQIVDFLYLIGLTALVNALRNGMKTTFLARAEGDILLRLELFGSVIRVTALFIGVNYGLVGVAVSQLIAVGVQSLVTFHFVMRNLKLSISDVLRIAAPLTVSNLLLGLSLYYLNNYWQPENIIQIFLLLCAGGLIYLISESIFDRRNFMYLTGSVYEILRERLARFGTKSNV